MKFLTPILTWISLASAQLLIPNEYESMDITSTTPDVCNRKSF